MKSTTALPGLPRRASWGTPNTAGVSIPHEVTCERIGYRIDGNAILNDISFTAKSGSVTCLLGPSGSGKTTLLRIIAGMEWQSAGQVLLDGREISGDSEFLPPEQRGIGLVFQDYALFPHLSIIENVRFGLRHLKRAARQEQAMRMLARVGLEHRANDYPNALSGGEQQRIALARALAPRPGVLLMDEPFSGLDSRLRDMMREETLGILRETKATSIIVTHDPEEALRMGDQIILLDQGKLEQAGTGRDLFYRPESLFAAGFFSELNTFEGKVERGRVQSPLGPVPINRAQDGDAAITAFRVGSLSVSTAKGDPTATLGRVLSSHFIGDFEHLRIGLNGSDHLVRVRVPAGQLSQSVLNGTEEVALTASIEGSFAFLAG